MKESRETAIVGCILGTAMGDSIGLCCEGMSQQRQARMFPNIEGHRFFFHRGMISDDTEHTCMTAQALIASNGDVSSFLKSLSRRLRIWLASLPGGAGLATLRSVLKLCIGFSGERSGVYSAGNGPAMRSAIIGVSYGDKPEMLRRLVRASTRITHTDPKAEHGAMAVALAAYMSSCGGTGDPWHYVEQLQATLGNEPKEFLNLVQKAVKSAEAGESTAEFARGLGLQDGIGGYIYHTVPSALHAWFRNPHDYRAAVLEIIRFGGDTDTTAAILGGIIGSGVGKAGIPTEWLDGLCEWPRNIKWMEELGGKLARVVDGVSQRPQAVFFPAVLLRNVMFIVIVLAHGFRRLLPPY